MQVMKTQFKTVPTKLTLVILNIFYVLYSSLTLIQLTCRIPIICVYSRVENCEDPDQIASSEASWLQDLQCFQKRINLGSTGQGLSTHLR